MIRGFVAISHKDRALEGLHLSPKYRYHHKPLHVSYLVTNSSISMQHDLNFNTKLYLCEYLFLLYRNAC